jgi:U-box domain
MADPASIGAAIALEVVKCLIQECVSKYQDFHSYKKECAAFQNSLRHVVDVLKDCQLSIASKRFTGNTRLRRPMELLEAATKEGGEVLEACSSKKKLYAFFYSNRLMGALARARADINEGLTLLMVSGVPILESTRRIVGSVRGMLDELSHQMDSNRAGTEDLKDLVRKAMEGKGMGTDGNTTAVVDIFVAEGLVSDAQDFSDQLAELKQQAENLRKVKVTYDEEILALVMAKTADEAELEGYRTAAGSMRQSQGSEASSAVQEAMICPISGDVMHDPVTLVDSGLTYDRKSLCTSLLMYPSLEPATGQRFDRPLCYTPNIAVRNMIMAQYGDAHYQKHDDDSFKGQYDAKWAEMSCTFPSIVRSASCYAGNVLTEPTSANTIHSGDLGGFSSGSRGDDSEREATKSVEFADPEDPTKNDTFSSDADELDAARSGPDAARSGPDATLGDRLRVYWRSRKVRWVVAGGVVLALVIIVGAVVAASKEGSPPSPSQTPDTPPRPTAFPSMFPAETFRATLPPYTNESLQDTSSPQYRAYEWVTKSDEVPERDASNNEARRLFRMTQRFAIATLYYSLGLDSWVESSVSECQWGNATGRTILCNADLEVVVVELNNLAGGRRGAISREVGLLTNLNRLDLSLNNLTSSIPVELGQLSSLTSLALNRNALNSSIPTELGKLSALSTLSLFSNALASSIPVELGQLTALTVLSLASNSLASSIPTELGQLSRFLRYLDLGLNSLSSSIPAELGQLSNLNEMYLSGNLLTGTFPSAPCSVESILVDCSEVACSCCPGCT